MEAALIHPQTARVCRNETGSLFGRVGQLEFPPAVVAALNAAVAPHVSDGVHLPGLQSGQALRLHPDQLLSTALKHIPALNPEA